MNQVSVNGENRRWQDGKTVPFCDPGSRTPFFPSYLTAATGKTYGLERVCRVLEFLRSTIYAQQAREAARVVPLHPVRRGPKPRILDADLLAAIRADLAASPFVGEGHRKVWVT